MMRTPTALLAAALALSACVLPSAGVTTTAMLAAGDAATALAAGEQLSLARTTYEAPEGQNPLVELAIRHADGRVMAFQQANNAPDNVRAQAPGGALAQVMGLFGEEAPILYVMHTPRNSGAPFICPPHGPLLIGYYEAPDGTVRIVGLKQNFQFETRPDGVTEAIPYSPDQVCARLTFRRT